MTIVFFLIITLILGLAVVALGVYALDQRAKREEAEENRDLARLNTDDGWDWFSPGEKLP